MESRDETGVVEQRRRCPMPDYKYCYDAFPGKTSAVCAWWIAGAECCGLVQIARKLNDVSAMLRTKYDYL